MGEGALRATHLGVWLFHAAISLCLHRHHPALLLRAPGHHAAQRLLLQADAPGRDQEDREHRGGREPRCLEAGGVFLEAAARLRRLRRVWSLPGGLPGLSRRLGAQPQADHRQAQAPHARRAPRPHPRRADQGRRAVGLHHLHGLRAGVPGLHRHRGHDHRSAALSHAVRGGAAVDRAAVAAEHPARRQSLGPAGRRATGLGRGSRPADAGAGQGGGVPLLGRLLRLLRPAQPGDRALGGRRS